MHSSHVWTSGNSVSLYELYSSGILFPKKLSQHPVCRPLKPDLTKLGMTIHWSFIIKRHYIIMIWIRRISSCVQLTRMMMITMKMIMNTCTFSKATKHPVVSVTPFSQVRTGFRHVFHTPSRSLILLIFRFCLHCLQLPMTIALSESGPTKSRPEPSGHCP